MTLKRAVLISLIFALFALGFLAGRLAIATVHAQGPIRAEVPKAWGRCVAPIPGGLVFEDAQGIVRMTDMNGTLKAQFDRN